MKPLKSNVAKFFYACSAFGVNLLNLVMGSYLCSAILAKGFDVSDYANHTFAGKNLVIPAAWAVFGVIAKVIDGVIDIPMAQLTDRLRSRWGRRRPAILMGMIPMIAAYCLFLLVPQNAEETWVNTIYYFVMLALFYTSYTLTMVTYYATFTEIVETEKDRRFITNVKSVCDIFYFIFGYVVLAALLNGFNVKIVALIALPLVLLMLIPIFMIKEQSTKDGTGPVEKTVNLGKSVAYTFKNKDFIFWMIVYSFMTFGVQLFLSGINEYFSITHMSMIFVMASSFAPVPFTFILYNHLIKKRGFRFAFQFTLLMFAAGMLGMFIVSHFFTEITEPVMTQNILGACCGILCSFSIGAIFAVGYAIPAQLAIDDEKRTGISHSAMYFAVQGLFSGVASGIGGTAVLTILKNNPIATHPGSFYITLFSAIGCLVAFAFTFILPKSIVNLGKEEKKEQVEAPAAEEAPAE